MLEQSPEQKIVFSPTAFLTLEFWLLYESNSPIPREKLGNGEEWGYLVRRVSDLKDFWPYGVFSLAGFDSLRIENIYGLELS